jgi:hypothetical protein
MAINLLSYTGDAALGLGSNPGIPATASKTDLDTINNTIRDVVMLDNQRNMALFQQKIRDRDDVLDQIMKNQVSSGDILPEYRPFFDQAEKNTEKAFQDWAGNLNDKEGYRKYQAAVQDLKDIAANAQSKTISIRGLEKEKASQILPRKQADYQDWIDQQKKQSFWNPVIPYQQLHDFSIDDILSGVNEFKSEGVDPNNPLYKVDQTYVDYADVLKNKRNQYINDMDAADSIDQFYDKIQRYDPAQLGNTIDALNKQLQKYNTDRNLQPGMRGYVEDIKVEPVQGRLLIKEPKTDFAAKYALANRQQFVTRTPRFDKDLAKFAIDKERLGIQAKKLGIDSAKAGAYIRNLDAKTRKYLQDEQAVGTDVSKQVEDLINASKPKGITITQYEPYKLDEKGRPITTGKKVVKSQEKIDAVYVNELPQSYQYINGPIISVDKFGKPTGKVTVGRLEPFISKEGRPYWINKYTNAATGEQVTRDSPFIKNKYSEWRSAGYTGSIDDMMKQLQKTPGALEVSWQGSNGTANLTSLLQSAKTFNAAATTKGEENIMNPPPNLPEEPPEPE